MIRMYYSDVIESKNSIVILDNKKISNIKVKDKKDKLFIKTIQEKTPVRFFEANELIHRLLNEIEYIEFWSNTKIYKID